LAGQKEQLSRVQRFVQQHLTSILLSILPWYTKVLLSPLSSAVVVVLFLLRINLCSNTDESEGGEIEEEKMKTELFKRG
tara:strand:- start:217 stop:453 length:237 start_codon:yes stop_codon:yes gene_type:complete